MPDGYTGEVADFTRAHTDVVGVKESVERELKKVWNEVVVLQSLWKGDAQRSFDITMGRFDTDAKNVNTALENIANQLMAAGSTYHEKEESQKDVFGNLGAQLKGDG